MHTLYFILYLAVVIAIVYFTVKLLHHLVNINTEGVDTLKPITPYHRPLEIGLYILFAIGMLFLGDVSAWIIPFTFFIISTSVRGTLELIYRKGRKEWVVSYVILVECVCLMLIGRFIHIF